MLRLSAPAVALRPRAAFCHPVRRYRQPRASSLQHALVVRPAKSPEVSKLQSWLSFLQDAKEQFPDKSTDRELLKDPAGASRQELDDAAHTFSRIMQSWVGKKAADIDPELQVWCHTGGGTAQLQVQLFFAVFTSNSKLVDRLLDELGHSWEGQHTLDTQTTPVLALAVVQCDHEMVHQLLSRGADPYTIPADFYLGAMLEEGMHGLPVSVERTTRESAASWCTLDDKHRLQQALDKELNSGFIMCYWLARATKLPGLTSFVQRVMQAHRLHRVPPLRMAVIDQEAACCLLYNQVMAYMGLSGETDDSPEHKPLVLLLAGPPGHGKTLIGQQLQHMMGVPYLFEDCSKLGAIVDLLGATGLYKDSERQPTFAAFTRGNSGKRSVVVLDEFEKMDRDAQNSLLGVLQNGWYIDPYSQDRVDCSKTIFLLTTNAADHQILKFWTEKSRSILEAQLQPSALERRLKSLNRLIKTAMAARTSRSLTSRVKGVIPFFPFTEFESMVVVQQQLLKLQQAMKAPANEKIGRLHGDISVKLQDQPQVLRKLAKEHYIPEEGARAVVSGINNTVTLDIKCALLEERLTAVGGKVKIRAAEDPAEPYELELDESLLANELEHGEKAMQRLTGYKPRSIDASASGWQQYQQSDRAQKRQQDGNVWHPDGSKVFRTAAQKEACLAAGQCMFCYGHGHKANQCSSSAAPPEGDPPSRA